jgi:uncharacterized RDD family membrane protein YckC
LSAVTPRQDVSQQALPVALPDSFEDSLSGSTDYTPLPGPPAHHDTPQDSADWRQEVSARLQAHRSRRATQQPSVSQKETRTSASHRPRVSPRATSAAATVAERYATAPSYSRYLETASTDPAESISESSFDDSLIIHGANAIELAPAPAAPPEKAVAPPAAQPVFPAELAISFDTAPHRTNQPGRLSEQPVDLFEPSTVEPATPLPANLIEFPRQLIAARKARPRLAETPVRYAEQESAAQILDGEESQLRIFEVEPETISHQLPIESAHVPAWHSIQLDSPVTSAAAHALPAAAFELPLQVAPVSRRVMAALVDASLVLFGYLAFITIFAATAPQLPTGNPAIIGSVVLLLGFFAAYQWIFFRWSDATPGMRYARIGLCTFNDENPSRADMQWRLLASGLSAAALGLGYLWALVDDDRLAWHDRMSRIYVRCY